MKIVTKMTRVLKDFISPGILIAWLAVTLPVQAHHSNAEFDFLGPQTEIEGKLLGVAWQNPHVHFKLQSVDKSGRTVAWDIETSSVSNLSRGNVKREDFKVGEKVKISGVQSRHSANRFLATTVLRENGEKLSLLGRPPALKSAVAGGGAVANQAATIFRVWVVNFGVEEFMPFWKKDYPLTQAARQTLNAWNPLTDTVTHGCKPKGMPTIMEQPYPLELVDKGNVILLRAEEYDTVRTIHVTGSADVEKQPKTLLGYSTGRWEGKTLVVTTGRISWRHFDVSGVPLGSAATVVERFTPSTDGTRLNYTMTVTDPETFTEPVELTSIRVWDPEEQVKAYNCKTSTRVSVKS